MKRFFLLQLICLSAISFSLKAQLFQNGSTYFEANYIPGAGQQLSCLDTFRPNTGGHVFRGNNIDSLSLGVGASLLIKSRDFIQPNSQPSYVAFAFQTGEDANARCTLMNDEYIGDELDSNYYHVNMSGGNTKVVVYAKADKPTTIYFSLGYGIRFNYPLPHGMMSQTTSSEADGIRKTIELTTTMTAYELDFADWVYMQKVNMFGIDILDPDVRVTIDKIILGGAGLSPFLNKLKGQLYHDENHDCQKQSGEAGIPNTIVEATNGAKHYVGYSDSDGNYTIAVDSGTATYVVAPRFALSKQKYYTNTCTPTQTVNANGSGGDFCCTDFAIEVNACTRLSVQISSDRRRRCFTNNTFVRYINEGSTASAAAVVKVIYPEFVEPISSIPAWTAKVGDTLIYQLGSLNVDQSGWIHIVDSVVCGREEIRNLTQCTKAMISPSLQCFPNHASWDGSTISVTGLCESGHARFQVLNKGENMEGTSAYRIYSNDTLIYTSTFQLQKNTALTVEYPANGATIRLEADQRPNHPGLSIPRAFVEACAEGPVVMLPNESFVLTAPQDDRDEEVAISCMTILDSYDPNDKQALPVGFTEDHLIKAGEEILYTIRFQNTGSDLAYTVKVVDTLDTDLDITSFVEGASSHPYTLAIRTEGEKSILTYTFNNINLKDSTTSEPESHGALSFYIRSAAGLADGVVLQNKADIFFDYNSAIVTNTVNHTIGTYTPTDFSKGNSVQVVTGLFDQQKTTVLNGATLYPNPASDRVTIELKQSDYATLDITDLSGQLQRTEALESKVSSVSLSYLKPGMYLYKIQHEGEWIATGKLLIK